MMRLPTTGVVRATQLCLMGSILTVAAGCSYPQRNVELAEVNYRGGYRWTQLDRNPAEDTIFIVTASGGGTRATALALSTLRGLDTVRLDPGGPRPRSLLDEVDLISSVSGGSVAAGFFALRGRQGFETLENDFIRRNGISALLWRGLNPVGLARLATPSYARIDLLVDYLNDSLFKHATYQTLLDEGTNSYLILNAADMTQGSVFSFTQPTFDLLCSDLAQLELANAVAASAAFPVLLSPLTLENYSPCDAQADEGDRWPPRWIVNATRTSWYDNQTRARRGRSAEAYLNLGVGPDVGNRYYIHLLDGGIADNLGVAEPFRLLTTADVSPQFFTDITQGRAKNVVFVMINARSDASSDLDSSPEPPGIFSMLGATIDSAIDNATFSSVDQVEVLLRERLRQAAQTMRPAMQQRIRDLRTYMVLIDFDAIDDVRCRLAFQQIDTTWNLPDREIDALLEVGGGLLAQDPRFNELVRDLSAQRQPLPTVEQACQTLLRPGS